MCSPQDRGPVYTYADGIDLLEDVKTNMFVELILWDLLLVKTIANISSY